MFKLALRNIFRNRLRTALALGAIICGVAAIILSGGFVEDVLVQLRESTIHSRLGHVQIFKAGYLDYGRREPSYYLIAEPKSLVDVVGLTPHVAVVATRVNFSGLANNGRADLPVIGEGVEPDKETRLGSAMTFVAGGPLRDDDPFGVVVGEGVAHSLNLHPGSPLNLTISTPEGALNVLEFKVVGVFRTFSKDYDDRAVRISLTAATDLLHTRAIHGVVVTLDDTENTDVTVADLRARLAGSGYEVKPWYELAEFYNKTVALYRRQFGALQFIILAMLFLSVASTVNMVIHERTGEFGTMLAFGCPPKQIFRLVMLENTLLGVIGGVLGVLFGVAFGVIVSAIGIEMPPPPGSSVIYTASIRFVPWVLGAAAVTGALAAITAAILPGRRAARFLIVDALRHNV